MKTKSAAGRNYRLKSDKVYKSKAQMIKPKTLQAVRAKQEMQRLNHSDNKNQSARKYVQNKLKTKAEMQKTAEIRNTDIQPVSENPIQAEVQMQKQKPTPQENIKVKKTDIKTKDSYIRSHTQRMADIKAKSCGAEINPHVVSQDKRSIKYKPKNTIKSVSEKTSTVKPVRKMHMPKTAQRTAKKSAKKAAVKTQKQVTKQAAKQAATRSKEVAQRSAQAAKAVVKITVKVTVKMAQAVAAAAKELISALAALGGWAVLLVVLIIVIIIAAIAASPFGIFISEEVTETGTIPVRLNLVLYRRKAYLSIFLRTEIFLKIYEAPDIIITENKVQEVFTMKKTRTFITLILTAALSVSMTATAFAAEIPRAIAPLNATEEQILIVENIIGDILDEVQNGLGYAEAENKAEPRVYKAVIAGETNGNGYGVLSDIMRNAILNVRDMYLRPEVYQETEEWLKVLLADTITEVENGMDVNTAIKEAHTKIYQSINPSFDSEVQFSIDTCYRDIPAVDMAVYNRTRKLLDDAHEIYIQKTAE